MFIQGCKYKVNGTINFTSHILVNKQVRKLNLEKKKKTFKVA